MNTYSTKVKQTHADAFDRIFYISRMTITSNKIKKLYKSRNTVALSLGFSTHSTKVKQFVKILRL